MTATPPLELLLSKLPDAKQSGNGWIAKCPAHDDQRPSLSVSEGDNGWPLMYCHAGCSFDAICAAINVQPSDLMADDGFKNPRRPQDQPHRRQNNGRSTKTYAKANDAAEDMCRTRGKWSATWPYHNAKGKPVGLVVRWDKEDATKEIRPVALRGDRWVIGGMPEPRPLYRLPDLADANLVFVCEGEKAVDAACGIGLVATTSAHGAQSPGKTDWSPLAGKEVIILPDNDEAGEGYAEAVAAILMALGIVVKFVRLDGLPEHGDIADWVEQRDAHDPAELRATIETMADAVEPVHPQDQQTPTDRAEGSNEVERNQSGQGGEIIPPDRPVPSIDPFQPFPTHALPEPMRGFVEAGAKAIGCDPSYIAMPLMTALAAAIGNTCRLLLKRGWVVPPILWTAIVGESGTAKTPAFKLALKAIRNRQGKALKQHAEAMIQYETDLAHYEKAMQEWNRSKDTDNPPPTKPDPHQAERGVVSDVTVEAMAPLLQANPRGLLSANDELAGWIGSFDRYASGKSGADAAHWLSMHNGESIVVDRKTGMQKTIYVPQASVSVCGGIQPAILHRALGAEHRESGLAARLLLSWPPRKPKMWTEADIDPESEAEIAKLFDRLYDLQPMVDDEGNPEPAIVVLTPGAKAAFVSFYNAHADEQSDLTGELSAAWSKLEEYAARLALVFHYVRWAAGDPTLESPCKVDAASMAAGIELTQWFKDEARRVYSMLSESEGEYDQRQLVEWIGRKGGTVTVSEVQRGHRQYSSSKDAKGALDGLEKAGYGMWEDQPTGSKGGRPTRIFRLSDLSTKPHKTQVREGQPERVSEPSPLSTSTKPHETREIEGFVDNRRVASSETQLDGGCVDGVYETPESEPDDEGGFV
jgi:uncharacterized protein DUF3987